MSTFVSTERRDAVALVTIDNPPMNALSAALLDELEAEIDALDADAGVRAIVLRGGGERAFVAGADIKEFPATPRVTRPRAARRAGCSSSGTAWTRPIRRSSRRSRASASAVGSSSRCAATSASAPTTRRSGSRRSSSA